MDEQETREQFRKWLAHEMEERNLSGEALGRMTGWSGSAVRAWLKGTRLPEERACDAIANAFGMDHNEVRRLAGRPESPHSHYVSSTAHATGRGTGSASGVVVGSRINVAVDRDAAERAIQIEYIPIIGTAAADTWRASWGNGNLFPVLRANVQGVESPAMLVVSGGCMEPDLRDGDLVIIDRARTAVVGDVVAIRIGDEITIKELWSDDDDEIVLRARQPGYPPIHIKKDDQGAELMGVVHGATRMWRI